MTAGELSVRARFHRSISGQNWLRRVIFVLLLVVWIWVELRVVSGMSFNFGNVETIEDLAASVFVTGAAVGIGLVLLNEFVWKGLRDASRVVAARLWMRLHPPKGAER